MQRVDTQQFTRDNTMLFQKGRWFIFLDLSDYSGAKFSPRLAHRCKTEDREKSTENWKSMHTCCIVIPNSKVCRDCRKPVPEVFQGFFNLTKWSYEK